MHSEPAPLITSDTDLLAYIGFKRDSEQQLIKAFAAERDLSVPALLAVAMRHYHTSMVVEAMGYKLPAHPSMLSALLRPPRPGDPDHQPYGCPDLGD